MDFFSNILKNTVEKAENLGKAAVNSLSPTSTTGSDDQQQQNDPLTASTATPTEQNDFNQTTTEYQQDENYDAGSQAGNDNQSNSSEKLASFNTAEMSQKAMESAKYFGSFIVNVANKAGQTVSATAKQLKSTVESVGIMQDFTKEQQEFIKEHGGKIDLAEPPWVGCEDEEKVKVEILSLSQDKRNFVRSPPAGVDFPFDMTTFYPVALALLKEDPELAKMRYEIVPKLVNEETFWRNYFYRVSLIKQDFGTGTGFGGDTDAGTGWRSSKSSSSSEGPDDPNEQIEPIGETEFVSDTFQQSQISVDDVRQDMYKLGIHHDNTEIDDELAKDLQEFDFVPGNETTAKVDDEEINRELANFDIK